MLLFLSPLAPLYSSQNASRTARTQSSAIKSYFIQWIIIFLCILCTENAYIYDELHIGGIFPIQGKLGWQGGQACMPAARLALEDVNSQKNLLPGFKLTLHSNDSEVSAILYFFSSYYLSLFLILL